VLPRFANLRVAERFDVILKHVLNARAEAAPVFMASFCSAALTSARTRKAMIGYSAITDAMPD